jgi:pyruvate-ferredoxin/flavodoxin oxidoreductase
MDGNTAVIMCEREASDAAGAYPITPSTQMGEFWAEAAAAGHLNISGRPLIFIEPEGEHAAAAVTAGMAMTGLRAANFSSGQGIAYMHESLYAAVGKRLTYVLNIGARAMTKATLNVHAGHDDYHCIDDTGFFQVFAKNAQSVADLNIIAHRIAELSLNPGAVAQDGFLTTHLIESLQVPERELIEEYLGRPDDVIETPTPAQRIIYGDTRPRIPLLWDVDNPVMSGVVQNQDAYMQSVAAQRPFFFDHIRELTDHAFDEFARLTGRRYERVMTYRVDDADYLILGQGSLIPSAEAVADHLRETRGIKVGVVDMLMFRPFPADLLAPILRGRKGVAVLERLDQPLAVDLPLMREVRATLSKCLENGTRPDRLAHPELPSFSKLSDAPPLYSGSFGMGSRDLQPEGIVAAVENMLPDGGQRRLFYLSIDFLRDEAATPKQQIHQQTIGEHYPHVKELAIRGSENPNLMPKESITVRFHSVGGWGAITTGKNLAMTLFDLLGYHIKANPKYGSEKKGQPTTYYLSAAPEPIRVNCEYFYVDVVLSPDPNVFQHTNALAGLKEGGVFVIQSDQPSPEKVWEDVPPAFQRIVIDKKIRIFYLDAFKIAREEATDPDLQLRMQGIAFQGAFFAASPLMEQAGLTDVKLLDAIRSQLQHKFGSKGARVVEDNMRVVKRGFDEVREVKPGPITEASAPGEVIPTGPPVPMMVERLPESQAPITDIHRFWEQTGSFYARGMGSDNLTDPFMGLGVMPACSALFRDMTQIRFQHPEFVPENCTACGNCWTVCPDTAIPGLVNEVGQIFDTVVKRVRKHGHEIEHLPKAVRLMERTLRGLMSEAQETDPVAGLIEEAIEKTIDAETEAREPLREEFDLFREELGGFQLSLTRPYYTLPEKQEAGSGALLSITVNPWACKGCMECVAVCDDDALRTVTQTDESVQNLRRQWDFWLDLPNTPRKYIRVDDLEEGIGALETILLDKTAYLAFTSGDGACLGCAEKTAVHLFVATIEALMQPRIKRHLERLGELIAKLERHIQLELVGDIDVSDPTKIARAMREIGNRDVTLAGIAQRMQGPDGGKPIDEEWLGRMTELLAKLKQLRWRYENGTTGRGRSKMGMLNATGCTSVWGSTFPFNPYPFPWSNHLFQDSPSVAMGVFEGHMAKMAEGFRAIRTVPARRARRGLHLLRLARLHGRGVGALPPRRRRGRRRRHVRHRLPEPLQADGVRQAGQLEHGRPGVYVGLHGTDLGHGPVRQGDPGQGGAAQGNRADRHGAPHDLRAPEHDRPPEPHDRGFHQGPEGPEARPVQPLQLLPARARDRRRHERGPGQAGRRVPRLPALPLRPRRRKDGGGVLRPRGQPGAQAALARLHPALPAGWPRQDAGGADDLRRLRDHRGALPQALPGGAAGHLEREHGTAGRVPRDGRGRAGGSLPLRVDRGPQAAALPPAGEPDHGSVHRGAPGLLDHAARARRRRRRGRDLPRADRGGGAQGGRGPHRQRPDAARRLDGRCRSRPGGARGGARRGGGGRCSRGAGGRRRLHGALDRHRRLHRLRRVHRPEPGDVRLQREQEGLHQGPERRSLQPPGQGRRALHGAGDPPGIAEGPQ